MIGKNNRPPARTAVPIPVAYHLGSSEVDGVKIIAATRIPRRWLHVAFALTPGTDPARTALAAAGFVTRVRAADKRLQLLLDQSKSSASGGELLRASAY